MKLPCEVDGQPAMIVGYSSGKKGKIHAIVITKGILRAVRLKDVGLKNLPAELQANAPVPLARKAV